MSFEGMDIIETNPSIEDFFGELLNDALRWQRVDLAETSRAYLVQLCGDFSRVEELHRVGRREEPGTPTLAWLYERAQTGAPSERFDAWRHLGDVALVVSSLFGAYLERRRNLVGVDYYVRMGAGAYVSAAACAPRTGFGAVLEELAQKFRDLVEVLTRVGEATTLPVANGIGRLYERWLEGPGDRDLQARLTRLGACPVLVGGGLA